jgi:DNA polymerase I-like protein with 3'-5' exonuclease and polymerase domains
MRICCFDLEANGFLQEANTIHCGVFKDIVSNKIYRFYKGSPQGYIDEMVSFMRSCNVLIAHNGIGYDWPLLEKLYGYKYEGKKIDTLIMSRLHNPKRSLPPDCQNRKARPHSLEAWGYRVGRGKPDHNEWSTFSKEMLHRCEEDVEILHLVYNYLKEETALQKKQGADWTRAYSLTFKLFEILQKQEEYGWLVNQTYMNKCTNLLQHWIDKIDRVLKPHLPVIVEVEETKLKGVYNYVKKPFLKNGSYTKATERWLHDANYVLSERVVVGPYSRVRFRNTNLDSNLETKNFLLSEGWKPKEWNVDNYGNRTSPKLSKDDPFMGIEGAIGRLVAKRVQSRHRKSTIDGWRRLIRKDSRIASSVSNLALTGRAIHRGIVNIPNCDAFFGRQMRRCFTCPVSRLLVGCDSAGCQDRMLAGRANDDSFTDMLLHGDKSKGTDGHSLATQAVNKVADEYKLKHISRSKGKNFNFAFKFGASDVKLSQMIKGVKESGTRVREELNRVFPAQASLVEKLKEEWKATAKVKTKTIQTKRGPYKVQDYYNGWIKGLDGRPVTIESEHALLVYTLQSDEAIMMADAYCRCYWKLNKKYKWGEDWAYVCWMHDEYTIECRKEIAKDVARIAEESIKEAGDYFKKLNNNYACNCPHIGEAKIGRNWEQIH